MAQDRRDLSSWSEAIPSGLLDIYRAAGLGGKGKLGLGRRPALLVVDVTYQFVGDRPEPILDSIKQFPLSCGKEGWDAVGVIRKLLDAARESGVPVWFTQPEIRKKPSDGGRWLDKSARSLEQDQRWSRIVEDVAPREGETVIHKQKPSAFFGTPLVSQLIHAKIDSLVICGGTTSGCIRATAVDGFSNNFAVALVDAACFDRHAFEHEVSLFDLSAKYADIISVDAALSYMRRIAAAGAQDREASPAR